MQNTPESIAKSAAIEATFRAGRVAPEYIWAAADRARADIYGGITPASEYASIAAYFNGAADAITALAAQRAAGGSY
jgi:hypothetical protein